jgi:hypothetical protein
MASSFGDAAKKRLLKTLPSRFVDPITGYPPRGEVQLSGLLGLFHQLGRVAWNKVPLLLPTGSPSGRMADELLANAVVCGEYQLFWNSETENRVFGSMPADLIFLSPDVQKVVIVENKIGAGFSGAGGDPVKGQLAKQADFLCACRIPERFLVVLSGKEFFEKKPPWYSNEVQRTLECNNRAAQVNGYLMQWEDVFLAFG